MFNVMGCIYVGFTKPVNSNMTKIKPGNELGYKDMDCPILEKK